MICLRPRLLCRLILIGFATWGGAATAVATQPVNAPVMPLAELRAGMVGEVWTVFQGTEPESFTVEVTGVIENTLGPGKSMILCRLTDPRVQNMGAVAGMSGSPLYIDGRFVGALSYQVQRFETVRFAGFTPAEDLLEVRQIALNTLGEAARPGTGGTLPANSLPNRAVPEPRDSDPTSARSGYTQGLVPLSPVFTFGGISPQVAELMATPLATLGLQTTSLGGSRASSATGAGLSLPEGSEVTLRPGQAVGAALAIGDITLAGTGTVSQVEGDRVLAFGHPLLGLGTVEVPMTTADIVAILPSNLSSFKIANTGDVIGTVRQDRLSAIYGEMGPPPAMVPVTVHTPQRTLNFSTVRHPRLTPTITATGLAQAILGSNDAGLSEGFRVGIDVEFPGNAELRLSQLYAGPEGFKAGIATLVQNLSTWLQNPVEEVFPEHVTFTVEPLPANPTANLDNVSISQREARIGSDVTVTLTLRDFQSASLREQVSIPIAADWLGRKVEILVITGPALDLLAGGQQGYPVSQIRDFSSYLDALQHQRRTDGLYIAVVTKTDRFLDQTSSTLELPDSLARIARGADSARFNERATREVLWETHVLPDRLVLAAVSHPLSVVD